MSSREGRRSRSRCSSRYICPEIELDILSRLPVKPLLRFKCASKAWLSLIDRNLGQRALPSTLQGFFHRPRKNNGPTPLKEHTFFGLNNTDHHDIDTSLSFLPCHADTEIVDSCNGLLLLAYQSVYYVCNPATKRWTVLPQLPIHPRFPQLGYDRFPFPSSRNPPFSRNPNYSLSHYVRLAYDPLVSSSDYKVIWVTLSTIHIFSSRKPNYGWVTTYIIREPIILGSHQSNSVFRNGALYISNGLDRITKYIPDQKFHQTIMFPNDALVRPEPFLVPVFVLAPFFGILGGSTCCAKISDNHVWVWTLIERHGGSDASWVLKHSSYLVVPYLDEQIYRLQSSSILAFHPFSEVIIIQTYPGQIWRYDINSRESVNVVIDFSLKRGGAFQYCPCYKDAPKENDDSSLRAQVNMLTEELVREKQRVFERELQIANMKVEIESLRQAIAQPYTQQHELLYQQYPEMYSESQRFYFQQRRH